MRQACGGPPALSQINHAADPVPSARGPNHARMLSLSHGPGPLSSPQHNSSGVERGWGVERPRTPRFASLPLFLSSFSFCGHQEIDAGREKQKRPSHPPSAAEATTAPFYCSSEGPVGNGQAQGGGGGVLFARGLPHLPGNNSPTSLCIGKQPILLLHTLLKDWAPASICPHLLIG